MGALGRQLLLAGLGGPQGLCAAEREMHDVASMGASVRCGDGAVGASVVGEAVGTGVDEDMFQTVEAKRTSE